MANEMDKFRAAAGAHSVYGRKHAEEAYGDFLAVMEAVRPKLAELDVTFEVHSSGLVLKTPFGQIDAEKTYVLADDHVAVALVFADKTQSEDADLGAMFLYWNSGWKVSTGEVFQADFMTDKYPTWIGQRVVIEMMAAKLAKSSKRCAALIGEQQ